MLLLIPKRYGKDLLFIRLRKNALIANGKKTTKMLRRINPTESQIQCAIVEWANKSVSPYGGMIGNRLLAIPNGGFRNKFEAKRLKKEGVKAGISDMFLAYPTIMIANNKEIYICGLWLEVKSKKGKVSEVQNNWFMEIVNHYSFSVVRSVDEGIQAIKDYLGMK